LLRTKSYLIAALATYIFFSQTLLSHADGPWQKMDIVNRQLDEVSGQFSNLQPNAEQEFSKKPPPSPSSVELLKNLVTADILETPHRKMASNVKPRTHAVDMGYEIFYYRYQEPDIGVMIHGPMGGYFADYAYRPADPGFFNNFLTNVYMLQARYASSRDLEYKGTGIVKNKHDDAMEFRGLIGKDYFIGTELRVTPYFGFGYRYLKDRGNGQLSNANGYGYDRKSHYYYLPLGGDMAINMPDNWEIDLNAEYDIFIQGMQKSFLSDGDQFTGYNNPDVTNRQDHGYGIRGSIKFIKRGTILDFFVEPYIRFWNIDQSKIETATVDGQFLYLAEPKNNTTEYGSRFGVQF
jgi:hypothetical protein